MKNRPPRTRPKGGSSADLKAQNPQASSVPSSTNKVEGYLKPGWWKTVRNTIKPSTLLVYLIGKWEYDVLTYAEFDLLVELVRRTRPYKLHPDIIGVLLLKLPFQEKLSDYEDGAKYFGVHYKRDVKFVFRSDTSGLRVPSMRLYKSLRKQAEIVLSLIITPVPRSDSIPNRKVRKERKRGHTDKGSLGCNLAARQADVFGGSLQNQANIAMNNGDYDEARKVRERLDSYKGTPVSKSTEPSCSTSEKTVVQRTKGERSKLIDGILVVLSTLLSVFGPILLVLVILTLLVLFVSEVFRSLSK